MPRLDNSDGLVLIFYDLSFDHEDPGATEPVDLCERCALGWDKALIVDHPSYDDEVYECTECGICLVEGDDGKHPLD